MTKQEKIDKCDLMIEIISRLKKDIENNDDIVKASLDYQANTFPKYFKEMKE